MAYNCKQIMITSGNAELTGQQHTDDDTPRPFEVRKDRLGCAARGLVGIFLIAAILGAILTTLYMLDYVFVPNTPEELDQTLGSASSPYKCVMLDDLEQRHFYANFIGERTEPVDGQEILIHNTTNVACVPNTDQVLHSGNRRTAAASLNVCYFRISVDSPAGIVVAKVKRGFFRNDCSRVGTGSVSCGIWVGFGERRYGAADALSGAIEFEDTTGFCPRKIRYSFIAGTST